MKPKGCKFEYERERDADLLRAYRQLLGQVQRISSDDIYEKLVNMPSKRFWVSEERASIVISLMLKGKDTNIKTPDRKEMFDEIFRRYIKMKKERPELSHNDIIFDVLRQQAPKFYTTPKTAKFLLVYAKKRLLENKQKSLRFMFM